ncbi:DUF952 domain-containing protein [Hymenobacter jeollabukensis]|uniref:DUF952 domain-containing protein n=1 Tax=Hymenobacter jeollabukensis TaxID=2025313 RepID=A0A5R8WKM3_9BACT|nr:DUF952 domain-containing protein [Hymenobacter jeollabukensis]TLM89620.1 DUF952 domain-containing protein [Hymenobacter jeollabukensis]
MLYRIAELAHWQQAQQTGFFASPDLQAEGFIHTSERHQVVETASRYYRGRQDLVLLELDEAALVAAGVAVKREWAPSRGQHFAHVFGPIPLAAVRRVLDFTPTDDGDFELPNALKELIDN